MEGETGVGGLNVRHKNTETPIKGSKSVPFKIYGDIHLANASEAYYTFIYIYIYIIFSLEIKQKKKNRNFFPPPTFIVVILSLYTLYCHRYMCIYYIL